MVKLFDNLVRPNLCYGCGVWGVDYGVQVLSYLEPGAGIAVPIKLDEHEALHKYYIKRVLAVCSSTPDLVIYGEVARLPLAFFRLKLIVSYWNRLCAMSTDRLLKKGFWAEEFTPHAMMFLESGGVTLTHSWLIRSLTFWNNLGALPPRPYFGV
jgi:hypothetical protein